jgi:hypothetical protein
MDGTYSTHSDDKKCTQFYLGSKQKTDHFGKRSKCENNTIYFRQKKGVKVGRSKQEGSYEHDNCETISLQINKIIHVTNSYLNA